jgi:hypothetical protein
VNEDELPEITDETQTHCVQCVWQGDYGQLVDFPNCDTVCCAGMTKGITLSAIQKRARQCF